MTGRKVTFAVGAAILILGSVVFLNRHEIHISSLERLNEYGLLPSRQAPYLYDHYLQKLNSTTDEVEIVSIQEDIESISPLIARQLEDTYKDTSASRNVRSAAAFGLIKADKELAASVFTGFLDSEDEKLVSNAIWDLARVRSGKPFDRVAGFADHPNPDIRFACAEYLGCFDTEESVAILEGMMYDDPAEFVRVEAKSQLQLLGYLTLD